MPTVWILNHYAQEPTGVGPTRHYALARNLAAHGWSAILIAASVEHGTGRQRLGDSERERLQTISGVPFLWLRTPAYRSNGIGRIVNMLSYTMRALSRRSTSLLPAPDVVVGSTVHPLAAWAGSVLARRHSVPFVYEIRDLWPQTLIAMGRVSAHGPAAIGLRWIERSLFRRAARVVSLLPGVSDYFTEQGEDATKVEWIPNGVDLTLAPELTKPPPATGGVTIMYLGAHGNANRLDTLLDALAIIERRGDQATPVRCRLIGDGEAKSALQAYARRLKLKSVSFEPAIPRDKIPGVAANAHAFVICAGDLPDLYRYGVSMNKLYEYLALGRPTILSMAVPNDPVAASGGGLSVAPESPEALAGAIVTLSEMPESERQNMGAMARKWVLENHDYRVLAQRFAEVLEATAGGRPA